MTLDNIHPKALSDWLSDHGWLAEGTAVVGIEPAGEGNMNITRRVRLSDERTLIVKQALPYVARYPEIPAPVERGEIEANFYLTTSESPLVRYQPGLLGHDRTNRLLVLEDLGRAGDFTSAYTARYITRDACVELERYLDLLHGLPVDGSRFQNMAMRSLNHEHLFVIPFSQANGLDLDAYTPGLASLGRAVADDTRIRHAAQDLGQIYLGRTLAGTPALLHGDFFPGSWLVGNDPAIRVIDPEFCFHGPQEFDLGVFIAHRLFIGESAESATAFLQNRSVDQPLTRAFAGIELMRRLLGVAQLPLDRSLDEKGELVNIGQTWLKAWFK